MELFNINDSQKIYKIVEQDDNSIKCQFQTTFRKDDQSLKKNKTKMNLYDLKSQDPKNNLILRKHDLTQEFNKINEGNNNQIEIQLDLTLRKSLSKGQIQKQSSDELYQRGVPDNSIYEIFNHSRIYKKNEIETINENLIKRNYKISNYLDSDGQADLFEGYFLNNEGKEENCVFKIYYALKNEEFEEEVRILKHFENSMGIVKILDYFQIDNIFILVQEKCQYSLKQELEMFKQRKKQFSLNELLQIIFDLLFGLNLFRIYSILHLDIKPHNILKAKNGSYCFSDFEISKKKEKNNEILAQYYTKNYAFPEQKLNQNIDYKSDVYSIGKTLKDVLNAFKKVNMKQFYLNQSHLKESQFNKHFQVKYQIRSIFQLSFKSCSNLRKLNFRNQLLILFLKSKQLLQYNQNMHELIHQFEKIIKKNMIQEDVKQRSNCFDIHNQFLMLVIQYNFDEFQLQYLKKLFGLINLYQFDINKDIIYFQEFSLLINQSILKLIQKHSNLNLYILTKYLFKSYKSHHTIGNSLMALQYLLKVFTKVKHYFQQNHPIIAFFLNEIGTCYQKISDNQNTRIYLFQSLELKQKIFYKNHPDIAISLTNIGKFYQQQGNKEDSLYYLQKSHEMRNQIYQGIHPYIAQSLYDLSLCFQLFGDIENYRQNLFDSHEMILQIFQGKNHPDIGKSLNNLGQYYFFISDFKKAQNQFLRSLEIRKQIHHGNHPDIALSLNNIGICYDKQGQHKKAIQYYLESFEIIEKNFLSNHPVTIKYLNNIGICYFNLGQFKKALCYLLEVSKMNKELYQRNHHEIVLSLNNVGLCYQCLGDDQSAIKYLLESFVMRKEILKGDDIEIGKCLNNIGICYNKLGKNKIGLKYIKKFIVMTKRLKKQSIH